MIKEKGLNRVVVAACTPRSHEPVFRDTLREGGINQYFYEMAQYPGALLMGSTPRKRKKPPKKPRI